MIEVLNETNPREVTCPDCGADLRYDLEDICTDDGDAWIICPKCGYDIAVDFDGPTADNFQYPDDFFSYKNGVKISDEKIQKWLEEKIAEIRNDDDPDAFYYIASGDSIAFCIKHSAANEYVLIVAKNYEELEIPID